MKKIIIRIRELIILIILIRFLLVISAIFLEKASISYNQKQPSDKPRIAS